MRPPPLAGCRKKTGFSKIELPVAVACAAIIDACVCTITLSPIRFKCRFDALRHGLRAGQATPPELVTHKKRIESFRAAAGLTIIETVVAITVLGIGVAATVGTLTKLNSIASTARNATGAYTRVMNQIDLIQSDSPFNPQKTNSDGTVQIPPELQPGTHTQNNVPVYQDPNTGVIVSGTMTTTVTDISSTYNSGSTNFPLTLYKAVVTLNYTYLSRNYSFSMSTIRASDI